MNQRYMDFVPAKKSAVNGVPRKVPTSAVSSVTRVVPTGVRTTDGMRRSAPKPVVKMPEPKETEVADEVDELALHEIFEERDSGVEVDTKVKMGVIEDLGPRFVNTDMPKRPLSGAGRAAKDTDVAEELKALKAEKLVGRESTLKTKKISVADGAMTRLTAKQAEPVEKPVENSATTSDDETFKTPKFVNLEKVKKRPLSKNVYQKEIKAQKEEKKGPVTIIERAEKESKVGMVLAVIITIILGATAGTVAFLLLPK